MPGIKRTKSEVLRDRELIAKLRLRNRTLNGIVQDTGLSLATVKREIQAIEADWRASANEAVAEIKARELRKLDQIEAEAWAEWERSKLDWFKRMQLDGSGTSESGPKHETKEETGGRIGEPRFLAIIVSVQERRAKLLGADKPAKHALTDPEGENERPGVFAFPVPPDLTAEKWAEWVQSLKPQT
jgi:hypothetical protein